MQQIPSVATVTMKRTQLFGMGNQRFVDTCRYVMHYAVRIEGFMRPEILRKKNKIRTFANSSHDSYRDSQYK